MRDFISGGHDFRGGIRRKGTNPRFVLSSNTNGRTRNSQRNCRNNWIALCGISAVREIWNGWATHVGGRPPGQVVHLWKRNTRKTRSATPRGSFWRRRCNPLFQPVSLFRISEIQVSNVRQRSNKPIVK